MHPIQRGASGGVLEVGVGCGVRPAHAERCPGFSAGRILTRKRRVTRLGRRPRPSRLRCRGCAQALKASGRTVRSAEARGQGSRRRARGASDPTFGGPALLPLPPSRDPPDARGTDRAPRSPSGLARGQAWTTPPCLGPLRPRERRRTPQRFRSRGFQSPRARRRGIVGAGGNAMKAIVALSALCLATAVEAGEVPKFQVDAAWPKPLPNGWIMGQAAGVAVDAQDHVWVVQRPKTLTDDEKAATFNPPRTKCCKPGPARCSSSMPRAISSRPGAARARATTGRRTSTASTSTTRASSGSRQRRARTARS